MDLFKVTREDWDYDEEEEWVVAAATAAAAKKHVAKRIEREKGPHAAQLKARRILYAEGVLYAAVHYG